MRYHDIFHHIKLEDEQRSHNWQLRIAIHPSAIITTKPDNKIGVIKAILQKALCLIPGDPKCAIADNDEAIVNICDGTMNILGRAVESRGKEVCIYFKNTNFSILSTEEHKVLILSLWRALQNAGVPLLYPDTPGDRKILGPYGLPTPFSFTSEESIPGTDQKRKEWEDHHGILFKEFVGFDQHHPLLNVVITIEDLQAAGIHFNSQEIYHTQLNYLHQHFSIARQILYDDIEQFSTNPMPNFREILFNDHVKNRISARFAQYCTAFSNVEKNRSAAIARLDAQNKEAINTAATENDKAVINAATATEKTRINQVAVTERGQIQTENGKDLLEMHEFQYIIKHYPHNSDQAFSAVTELADGSNLFRLTDTEISLDDIETDILKLRQEYDARINVIKQDYRQHLVLPLVDKEKQPPFAPGFLARSKIKLINWSSYYPGLSDNFENLIEKNPERMQAIYRRIIFLEHERKSILKLQQQFDALPAPIVIQGAAAPPVGNQAMTAQQNAPGAANIPIKAVQQNNNQAAAPQAQQNPLPRTRIDAKKDLMDVYSNALNGINRYTQRNRGIFTFQTHLGLFSRIFDNATGLNRAKVYQSALSCKEFNLEQKALLLYALLVTTNGIVLKEDVAEAILGHGNRNVRQALNIVEDLVFDIFNDFQNRREVLVGIADEIIKYANRPITPDLRAIPGNTWAGIFPNLPVNVYVSLGQTPI